MKILLVCLGNICRSPMAEGILRDKLAAAGLNIETDSAGTSSYHIGEQPDQRAIAKSAEFQTDISMLRARQLLSEDFELFDRIYVMDQSNYENAASLVEEPELLKKLDLFLNLSHPGENRSVPDPYFGGEEGFEKVYQMLDQASETLVTELKESHG